jgi:hypothetical protein
VCVTIEIPLTQGKVALIDAEDLALVEQYLWHACERERTWYAATSANRRKTGECIYLHRLILEAKSNEHVDHRNGDGLDCRRANLRLCTNAENRRNMRKSRGKSRFKGVCPCASNTNRKWEAYIWLNNKKIPLGTYATEEEAARAYNAAALHYHAEFANLNTIPGLSHEESVVPPVRNRKPGRPYRRGRTGEPCRLHGAAV